MSASVDEKFGSRVGASGDSVWEERIFIVRGSDDPTDIDTAVLSHTDAPTTITNVAGTLYRTGVEGRDQVGNGLWVVTVRYEGNEFELAVGQKRVRWDTTGGTRHILNALEHIETYDESGSTTTDDWDGLLGWDGQQLNGADVPVPLFNFEIDIALADISGLAATVKSLVGKTNNASFYDHAAGEALFLGARRNDRGNGIKDVTMCFAGGDNLTSVACGPITIAAVGAWELVSIARDPNTSVPKRIYLDRVLNDGNFALLGVGTSE